MAVTLVIDLGAERQDLTREVLESVVEIKVGNAEPRSSNEKTGRRRTFSDVPVDPGTALTFVVAVPSLRPGALPDLVFKQRLTADGSRVLQPSGSSNSSDNPSPARPRHPRVTLRQAKPPYLVEVDVTFVQVTRLLDAVGALSHYRTPWYLVAGKSEPSLPPGTDPSSLPPAGVQAAIHHGCRLSVFQMTNGTPKCWAVVIPPNLGPQRTAFNVLVFFQPALIAARDWPYTSALDCPGLRKPNLPRYTRDPPAFGPYHFQEHTDGGFHEETWPYTGFEGQLAASGKPVVLVMPYAKGPNMVYGDAMKPRLADLLASLLVALWGEGEIAAGVSEGVTLTRLAVGGFSAGCGGAIGAFMANAGSIREVYLMDPGKTKDLAKPFVEWLKRGDRQLCLVGGDILDAAGKKKEIEDQGGTNVFATPASAAAYDTPGTPWEAAMSLKPDSPDRLSVWGAARKSLITTESNVWLASNGSPATLRAEIDGKPIDRPVTSTSVEAAGLVRLWQCQRDPVHPKSRAVTTERDLDEIAAFTSYIHDMRHQSGGGGGVGKVSRYPYGPQDAASPDQSTFEGHLHFCLKHSPAK